MGPSFTQCFIIQNVFNMLNKGAFFLKYVKALISFRNIC